MRVLIFLLLIGTSLAWADEVPTAQMGPEGPASTEAVAAVNCHCTDKNKGDPSFVGDSPEQLKAKVDQVLNEPGGTVPANSDACPENNPQCKHGG